MNIQDIRTTPILFRLLLFSTKRTELHSFFIVINYGIPIGLTNLFASITVRRSIRATMQYPQASCLNILKAFCLRSFPTGFANFFATM
ncbi:MAG TPA: hypothetical protein VK169_04470 [Saprospiraceae bacterium]|nr:hypothetical protein [Saprospiraceae bacterium]